MGDDPGACPVCRLGGIGKRVTILGKRSEEFMDEVGMRTAVPGALGKAQVLFSLISSSSNAKMELCSSISVSVMDAMAKSITLQDAVRPKTKGTPKAKRTPKAKSGGGAGDGSDSSESDSSEPDSSSNSSASSSKSVKSGSWGSLFGESDDSGGGLWSGQQNGVHFLNFN